MNYPDINKIIDDTRKYLENVKSFYPFNVYLNNDAIKHVNETVVKEEKVEYKAQPSGEKLISPKTVIEKDLFGNEVTVKEDWQFAESLEEMNVKICNCLKCALGSTRTKFVFGVGNPKADIVLVGEAPGANEDKQGLPFVGEAGKLLNRILASIELKREEVYICNILKCRPPGNRNPLPEEIELCEPYLKYQLNLIKPKLILALGKFAAETLLNLNQPLNKMRGKVHYYNGIRTMVTFHPAALLRNFQWKRPTWEDMQQFKKLYDELK
jgi:DNA polymerase